MNPRDMSRFERFWDHTLSFLLCLLVLLMMMFLLVTGVFLATSVEAVTVSSTAYCEHGLTASGAQTHPGVAASNRHPLGTKIRLSRPAFGRRVFVIRDRIGYGSELDLWTGNCGTALAWGRRTVTYQVVSK